MYFWLDFAEKHEGISIQHRLNNENKEVRISPYPGDGFCYETNTGYEFQGYYYDDDISELTRHCKEQWKQIQRKLKERTTEKCIFKESGL